MSADSSAPPGGANLGKLSYNDIISRDLTFSFSQPVKKIRRFPGFGASSVPDFSGCVLHYILMEEEELAVQKVLYLLSILFLLVFLPAHSAFAEVPGCGNVTGVWNFNEGDFSATIGADLMMVGNLNLNQFGQFGFMPPLGGSTPKVVRVFAYGPGDYLEMRPNISANGGGAYVNQYTLVMDAIYAERLSVPAAIYQTNPSNNNAVECLVSTQEGNDGIGFDGQYDGDIEPLVWYRIGIVVDTVANTMSKYIDGSLVGVQTLDGVDGRWSLYTAEQGQPTLLFTSPNNLQETREVYVNSLAIVDCAMSAEDMAELGGPSPQGLFPGPPPPRECVTTGLWDFNQGDLTASVGTDMGTTGEAEFTIQFGTTTQFGIPDIQGQPASVLSFPNFIAPDGLTVFHGIDANGGGLYVNQYTLVMDVLWNADFNNMYRCLMQTDDRVSNDGDLFVGENNGVGVSGQYDGEILPDTWYRLAFSFDLVQARLDKYINGVLVGTQTLSSGLDGRWSLYTALENRPLILFADNDGETGSGYVNSVSMISCALTASEIATFGGPTAAGIGVYTPLAVTNWSQY